MVMFSFSLILTILIGVGSGKPQGALPYNPCNNSPTLCQRSYSDITYLGAHNSPFVSNAANRYASSGNQFYSTTTQLDAGVRLLSTQIQWNNDSTQILLCHTTCELYDAGSLESWLAEIKQWMDHNTNEVVTLLLVNSANAASSQIASAYVNSGIIKYGYAPTKQPTQPWPALSALISSNLRLITFVASLPSNTGAPYLLNEFDSIFENPNTVTSPQNFTCLPDQPASLRGQPAAAKASGHLFLMNHFLDTQQALNIDTPNVASAANTNSADPSAPGSLGAAVQACKTLYGKAPNFVLVDFFNVGSAIVTVDRFNNVTAPVGRKQVANTAVSDSSVVGGASSF
jgi:hypothetical protein